VVAPIVPRAAATAAVASARAAAAVDAADGRWPPAAKCAPPPTRPTPIDDKTLCLAPSPLSGCVPPRGSLINKEKCQSCMGKQGGGIWSWEILTRYTKGGARKPKVVTPGEVAVSLESAPPPPPLARIAAAPDRMNSGAGAAAPVTCTDDANRASSMSNDPDACSAIEARRTWPCVCGAEVDGWVVEVAFTSLSAAAAASIPGNVARTARDAFSSAS
jgi:hypothetical protein